MAVVEKDADGKIHVHHGIDRTTASGAIGGGALGLLLGLVFFPVAGLAIGAAVGGLIGRSLHQNIDKKLVEDVTADLTENTSALFVLGTGNASAVIGALEPFKGKVYQSTLDRRPRRRCRRPSTANRRTSSTGALRRPRSAGRQSTPRRCPRSRRPGSAR